MKKRHREGEGWLWGEAGKTQGKRANGEQMPKIRSGTVSAPSDRRVNSTVRSSRKEPPTYFYKRGQGSGRGGRTLGGLGSRHIGFTKKKPTGHVDYRQMRL